MRTVTYKRRLNRSPYFYRLLRSRLVVTIVIAVVIVVVISYIASIPRGPIPSAIQKQLTSTLYVPAKNYGLQRKTVKYDTADKVLTFRSMIGRVGLTVSEQPTPDSFTDIPDLYTKLLDGLDDYQDFNTLNGMVHLTKPPNQNGNQVAVLNNAGTLMFVRADGGLSAQQWQQFFTNLNAVK